MLENLEIIFKSCLYLTGILVLIYIVLGTVFETIKSIIFHTKNKKLIKNIEKYFKNNIEKTIENEMKKEEK